MGETVGEQAEGHSTGTVDLIGCTGGEIVFNAPLCTIHFTEQEGIGPVHYTAVNESSRTDVTVAMEATNTVSHHEGFFCGGSAHTDTEGAYDGRMTIRGYSDEAHESQTDFSIT